MAFECNQLEDVCADLLWPTWSYETKKRDGQTYFAVTALTFRILNAKEQERNILVPLENELPIIHSAMNVDLLQPFIEGTLLFFTPSRCVTSGSHRDEVILGR